MGLFSFKASDPVSAIANVANTVLERVLPDKPAILAAQNEIAKMQVGGEIQAVTDQLQVNLAEAASRSTFVAGWRPFIGWISGAGLGYEFLLRPLLTYATACFGGHFVAPDLDMSSLNQLLFGMLGLASMRTVEKIKGVNSGH